MNLPFFAVEAYVPGGVQNQAGKNSKNAFQPVPVPKSTFPLWPSWPHRTPQTPKQLKSQKSDSKVTFGAHPKVTPKVTQKWLKSDQSDPKVTQKWPKSHFWVTFGVTLAWAPKVTLKSLFRVGFWQNGFFADFYFWAAGFCRGFCRRIFSPHFCGKKCPEKSSRKIPDKILQILYNKNPRQFSAFNCFGVWGVLWGQEGHNFSSKRNDAKSSRVAASESYSLSGHLSSEIR